MSVEQLFGKIPANEWRWLGIICLFSAFCGIIFDMIIFTVIWGTGCFACFSISILKSCQKDEDNDKNP